MLNTLGFYIKGNGNLSKNVGKPAAAGFLLENNMVRARQVNAGKPTEYCNNEDKCVVTHGGGHVLRHQYTL